jgi:hypothetical protein
MYVNRHPSSVENAPSAAFGLFLYGRGVVVIDDGGTKIDFEKKPTKYTNIGRHYWISFEIRMFFILTLRLP